MLSLLGSPCVLTRCPPPSTLRTISILQTFSLFHTTSCVKFYAHYLIFFFQTPLAASPQMLPGVFVLHTLFQARHRRDTPPSQKTKFSQAFSTRNATLCCEKGDFQMHQCPMSNSQRFLLQMIEMAHWRCLCYVCVFLVVLFPKVCGAPTTQAPTAVAVEAPLTGIESDFYQTIIQNNLFAPLGTVLTRKSRPGSHLSLLATFTNVWITSPMALIENTTTGQQSVVAVGESFGAFRLTHVNAKNVRLQHNGATVRLSLSPIFFLD